MIAAVILAAGTSSRMGRPKQLLRLGGRTVLQHVVDTAATVGFDDLVVVLGHRAVEVAESLRLPEGGRLVMNPDYGTGQSSSLRAGLRGLGEGCRAAVVLLGDQPGLAPDAVRGVIETYGSTGARVVRASYGGRPGHPMLLDRRIWAEVEAVEGDIGARDLLVGHPEWVVAAEVPGEPPPDLDTWDDYRRMGGEP